MSIGQVNLKMSYEKPNSKKKQNSDIKTGQGTKSSAVNQKFESKSKSEPKNVKINKTNLKQSKNLSQTKNSNQQQVKQKIKLIPPSLNQGSNVASISKVNQKRKNSLRWKIYRTNCDMYNHTTSNCFFNKYCSYYDMTNYQTKYC